MMEIHRTNPARDKVLKKKKRFNNNIINLIAVDIVLDFGTKNLPMIIFESWTPVRGLQKSLQCASQVNKAVTHEEEHGEQWSQDVDVAEENAALADHHGQKQGSVL